MSALFEAGRIALLKDGKLKTVIEKIDDVANGRFNDVIATPSGNVYCGTLSYDDGGTILYHLNRDRTLKKIFDGLGISNGLGFSPDLHIFYFADSKMWYMS